MRGAFKLLYGVTKPPKKRIGGYDNPEYEIWKVENSRALYTASLVETAAKQLGGGVLVAMLFVSSLVFEGVAESKDDAKRDKMPTNVELLEDQIVDAYPMERELRIQSASGNAYDPSAVYSFENGNEVCSGLLSYFPADIIYSRGSREPDFVHSKPTMVGPTTCREEK